MHRTLISVRLQANVAYKLHLTCKLRVERSCFLHVACSYSWLYTNAVYPLGPYPLPPRKISRRIFDDLKIESGEGWGGQLGGQLPPVAPPRGDATVHSWFVVLFTRPLL